MHDHPLLDLAQVFVPLSLLSFGGGLAIIADVRHQSVMVHHWISNAEFLSDYVVARMCPGPTSLIVGLIGWRVAGVLGALVAGLAIFLPSSALVYGVAHIWARQRGAAWQGYVERGIAPLASGMILASSFNLLRVTEGGALAWVVALAAAAILTFSRRLNPLVMIAAGAGVFLVAAHV